MTKFTDEYFKTRAHDYLDKLKHERHPDDAYALYLLLKEVNRDVRHACAELRVREDLPDVTPGDFASGIDDGESALQFELGRREGFIQGVEAHASRCMNI